MIAVYFSRNVQLLLNLLRMCVVFDWLDVGFILILDTENTKGINFLKTFLQLQVLCKTEWVENIVGRDSQQRFS